MPRAPEMQPLADPVLSRRSILRGGAYFLGGLLVGIELRSGMVRANEASARMNAFVHVPTEGHVRLIMPAVEMGQGVYTSQAMCLGEELDLDLDQIVAIHAPPDQASYGNPIFIVQATGGSTTTMAWTEPLRRAGATARAMLLAAAAAKWSIDTSDLITRKGVISNRRDGRSFTYGELAEQASRLPPPATVVLKSPEQFRLMGSAAHRIDTPDKAIGKTVYGIDVVQPGMKFAALMGSPVIGGKVKGVQEQSALAVRGVRQVVVLDDLVAVIADNSWAAQQGLKALAIEWVDGANAKIEQVQLWAELETASREGGVIAQKVGDAADLLRDGELFEATYELPFLAHAPMEPLNCTVHVRDGSCDVWVGTQVPGFAQAAAAKVLGVDSNKVTINNHMIGGGFGRRLEADYVATATRIAKHVDGPVKVIWSREEDIKQDIFRPLYHDRLKAKVENGRITAWHHRVTGASILARWLPPAFKDGIDGDAVDGAIDPPYEFPNILVEYVRHESIVPVGFWRGVGPNSSVFSVECFIDLIAKKTGADPVALRRGLLKPESRALKVLNAVVDKSSWARPMQASPYGARTGRGVALMHAFGSYLACVADVAVADSGDVRVVRVVVAADVGRVINPDIVAAQIQGGVTFGMSAVLHNQVTFAGGRVQQSNFNDYRLVRIDEMPTIDIDLIHSTEKPGGIGEPGTVIVQPAIANAIFAATGLQLTRMPVAPELLARAV